jgi:cytochrome c oxidase cbb3-type subunit 3
MSDTQRDQEIAGHEYDGIREYDNPLPRWWVWLFYLTIGWAIAYAGYYMLGPGPTPQADYEAEMAEAAKNAPATTIDAAELEKRVADPANIAAGKEIFAKNCTPCHGADGGGVVGPNLTDDYYIHGAAPADLYHTIREGVPEKGMLTWKKTLKPDELVQVTAFVKSLRGTTPANPKAPEGQKY